MSTNVTVPSPKAFYGEDYTRAQLAYAAIVAAQAFEKLVAIVERWSDVYFGEKRQS